MENIPGFTLKLASISTINYAGPAAFQCTVRGVANSPVSRAVLAIAPPGTLAAVL